MPRMDLAKHSFSENETEKYDNLTGIYLLKAPAVEILEQGVKYVQS